jgi:DNA-binding NarL/FixJ family response regulator
VTRVLIFDTPDAFGVIDVDAPAERIVAAINKGSWEDYLPDVKGPAFARQQSNVVVVTRTPPMAEAERPKLSRREQQVLVLLGEGLTTSQIGLRLGLRPRTIRMYVASLKAHLSAQNVQQLMARAVALGLVHPEI